MAAAPPRPVPIRVAVFIDGQNLYHQCRRHFGWPWVHPGHLAQALIDEDREKYDPHSHVLSSIRFYTGIHDPNKRPAEHAKMSRRLADYSRQNITVVSLPLKYESSGRAREKGIDVRLAIDMVRLGRKGLFDVSIIVSEDSDLDEAVQEVYSMRDHERWVAVQNALPWSAGSHCHWLPSAKRRRRITQTIFSQLFGSVGNTMADTFQSQGHSVMTTAKRMEEWRRTS